jgi:deoxycytidine triphosphate deaminase
MILSDRSIREALAAGRIVIDPFDETCIQPASVDLRMGRLFRVFRNHTAGTIDVKLDQADLTELIEVPPEGVFMLHPGEFVLGSTHERVGVADDLVGRVEGKALAVDTPIPTPDGWRTMGDLHVGSRVFTDTGAPVRVKDATPVLFGRPCFEVELSDGCRIVADASHRWETLPKRERKSGRFGLLLFTTEQLARSVRVGAEYNHLVPLAGAVQYAARELPIPPYVLGSWLADGTSTSACITTADADVVEDIDRAGEPVHKLKGRLLYRVGGAGPTRDPATGRHRRSASLSSRLRDLGLLGNKRVPRAYLEASVEQRFALLQGLMDADGYCDVFGRCEFTSTRKELAVGVVELLASLGFKPAMREDRAQLHGRDCGPRYRVTLTPDRPVFRLRRKLDRQKLAGFTHRARSIVAVRPVPSVPVRCIEVDAPHGMYLAGRSFVPTHNSSLGRLGLLIHSTAGFVDPGFDGHITLELSNVASLPITLYPGMKIGQVSFIQMTTPAEHPYGSKVMGSKYQGQQGPTPSRYFENFRS